jgi:hypothetical protein
MGTKNKILAAVLMVLVCGTIVGCSKDKDGSSSQDTTKNAQTQANKTTPGLKGDSKTTVTISGKVKEVTMRTDQVEINFTTFTITQSKDKSVSLVHIQMEGKPDEELVIPVDNIVELRDFRDLKGRHVALGGLLILSPLKDRLVGKNVELVCAKARTGGAHEPCLIVNLKIIGLDLGSAPRFSGEITFKNETDKNVWVDRVLGFEKEVFDGEVLEAGQTRVLLKDPMQLPEKVVIVWWFEKAKPQKNQIDFSELRAAINGGAVLFRFTRDSKWIAEVH